MDSTKQLVAVVSCIVVASAVVERCNAAEYKVGGDKGWVLGGFNYAAWASQHRFQAGDTLLFQYPPGSHTVLQVSQQDYKACVTSRPVLAATGGNNRVRLSRGGTYWFICGVAGHCSGGMRFAVQASGLRAATTTTTTTANPQNQILIAYPTHVSKKYNP